MADKKQHFTCPHCLDKPIFCTIQDLKNHLWFLHNKKHIPRTDIYIYLTDETIKSDNVKQENGAKNN